MSAPSPVIYWFRNDLRVHDNPALYQAVQAARLAGAPLWLCYVHDPAQQAPTRWGFVRQGVHRRVFLRQTLDDLQQQLRGFGQQLFEYEGAPAEVLSGLCALQGSQQVYCEDIAAPEEQDEVQALRRAGLKVHTLWQSSLIDMADLPFEPRRVPEVFTAFRQALESAQVGPRDPVAPPQGPWPAPPAAVKAQAANPNLGTPVTPLPAAPSLPSAASFPYTQPHCQGGETAALQHLQQYCARKLPHTYKATRNGLVGLDYSSKFSPWLATGALSPRTAMAAIYAFEDRHGGNDGTYWLWFELLWRDHFRWLHLRHGRRLYHARGLLPPERKGAAPSRSSPQALHSEEKFQRWCEGRTGHAFVDAAMQELRSTGYTSNRMRQVVASYLIHDLGCDWRAGAAWFESQLVDYDVYSNQGNWLYLAGRGTDPRGGRRFNPDKQAQDYDADGRYRALWRAKETA